MQVFMVRSGKLLGQEHFILDGTVDASDAELFSEFLKQFYTARSGSSGRTASTASDVAAVRSRCARRANSSRRLRGEGAARRSPAALPRFPKRSRRGAARRPDGDRAVADRAQGPARAHLASAARRARRVHAPRAEERRTESQGVPRASGSAGERARPTRSTELAAALDLPGPPHRIECYDISNIQGTNSGQLDGRLRRRPGKEERLPALQDSIRQGPQRLRDDARDVAPAFALLACRRRSPADR